MLIPIHAFINLFSAGQNVFSIDHQTQNMMPGSITESQESATQPKINVRFYFEIVTQFHLLMDKNQSYVRICTVGHQIEVDFTLLDRHCQELIVGKESGAMVDNV